MFGTNEGRERNPFVTSVPSGDRVKGALESQFVIRSGLIGFCGSMNEAVGKWASGNYLPRCLGLVEGLTHVFFSLI